MSTLETQYKNYLKENPESTFTFEEWSDWKFSNMELPPPHNGLRPIDEYAEELSDWDVTLMDGLENEPPYVSDDFQIGPDGAYEATEEWELYQQYRDEFAGYEDVPGYDWFVNELKTNEKFKNRYGKSNN